MGSSAIKNPRRIFSQNSGNGTGGGGGQGIGNPIWEGKRFTFPYTVANPSAGWGEGYILIPIPLVRAVTVTAITCRVTTLFAGSNIRLGLYDADDDGYPTTLYEDSGNISGASTGDKTFTFTNPISLTGTIVYAAIFVSTNSLGFLAAGNNQLSLLERPAGTNISAAQYRVVTAFAALPTTFPAAQTPIGSYGIMLELTAQ